MTTEKHEKRRRRFALVLLGVCAIFVLAWSMTLGEDPWFEPFGDDRTSRGSVMGENLEGKPGGLAAAGDSSAGTRRGKDDEGDRDDDGSRFVSRGDSSSDSDFDSDSGDSQGTGDQGQDTDPAAAGFGILASPSSRTIGRGETARYEVGIDRSGGFQGTVSLSASGLPGRSSAAFSGTELVITTRDDVKSGSYAIVISGTAQVSGERVKRTATVSLRVREPADFALSGTLATTLSPGSAAPVDLTITNPHNFAIRVTSLATSVDPRTSSPACSGAANFAADPVRSSQLAAGLVIPRRSSRTLSQLGVPSGEQPSVRMLNLATNQDACKGVRIFLQHAGRAVKA